MNKRHKREDLANLLALCRNGRRPKKQEQSISRICVSRMVPIDLSMPISFPLLRGIRTALLFDGLSDGRMTIWNVYVVSPELVTQARATYLDAMDGKQREMVPFNFELSRVQYGNLPEFRQTRRAVAIATAWSEWVPGEERGAP